MTRSSDDGQTGECMYIRQFVKIQEMNQKLGLKSVSCTVSDVVTSGF